MSPLHIDTIASRIQGYDVEPPRADSQTRQAAVATILRPCENDTEALFILRATKEGDPWSGHMAFPGGHRDPGDESLRATAERETLEEIGLALATHARYLGPIDPVRANPRGRNIDMVVQPYVYILEQEPPVLTPNYEVADILWGSLREMYTRESLTQGEFEVGGQVVSYPGYVVGEHIVWGLTLRMLDQFFELLDPAWEAVYQ